MLVHCCRSPRLCLFTVFPLYFCLFILQPCTHIRFFCFPFVRKYISAFPFLFELLCGKIHRPSSSILISNCRLLLQARVIRMDSRYSARHTNMIFQIKLALMTSPFHFQQDGGGGDKSACFSHSLQNPCTAYCCSFL